MFQDLCKWLVSEGLTEQHFGDKVIVTSKIIKKFMALAHLLWSVGSSVIVEELL
jgi:hypothetical protein